MRVEFAIGADRDLLFVRNENDCANIAFVYVRTALSGWGKHWATVKTPEVHEANTITHFQQCHTFRLYGAFGFTMIIPLMFCCRREL